jgi:hypothetical protein
MSGDTPRKIPRENRLSAIIATIAGESCVMFLAKSGLITAAA